MLVPSTEIEQSGDLTFVTWPKLKSAASLARQGLRVAGSLEVNIDPRVLDEAKPLPGIWAIGFTPDGRNAVCLQGRGRPHLMKFDPDLGQTVCPRHPSVRVALRTEVPVTEETKVEVAR